MPAKSYGASDKTQLSPHFNVAEFKCKCGSNHSTKIKSTLVDMLEKIFVAADCSKIILTSGYRCPRHDKNVGGSGGGQHTMGYAADVICYDKRSKAISSKKLSCIAQDLGFGGIANITASYNVIHLDVRTRGTYMGDETKGNHSVTTNFYAHYKLTKKSVYGVSGAGVTSMWSNKYDKQILDLQEVLNGKGSKLAKNGLADDKTYAVLKKYSVHKGDGTLIRWVQQRLNALGYDCGEPNGVCDSKTYSAINKFQKKNKLGVGYLGGEDWIYLIK